MQGKNILIVGASQGIGKGIAEYLVSLECNVILVARNKEKLQKIQEKNPKHIWIYSYDVKDIEHVENVFVFCLKNGLKLDGMVYCAGETSNCPIKLVSSENIVDMYSVNVFGYAQMVRFFGLKKYSNAGSSVVAISSLAALKCEKSMSVYASSKAAMNAMTSTFAKELISKKIRVNAIAPAAVDTSMYEQTLTSIEDYEEYLLKSQPLGVIPIDQVVNLVYFLLSPQSEYITGTVIPISAGMDI